LIENPHTDAVVVFDLGRVLVHIDFDAFPKKLGLNASNTSSLTQAAVRKTAFEYETGKLSTDKFLMTLEGIFKHKYSREQLLEAWDAIICEENAEMLPIVDAVQEKHDTAILSNTGASHFEKAYSTTSIIKKFDKRFLSYEIGAMKPDPVVYRHVIESLGVDPVSILFIDDIEENVKAAEAYGMLGIVYEGAEKLGNELKAQGIIS
jgi:glucose-1-phosphatase